MHSFSDHTAAEGVIYTFGRARVRHDYAAHLENAAAPSLWRLLHCRQRVTPNASIGLWLSQSSSAGRFEAATAMFAARASVGFNFNKR